VNYWLLKVSTLKVNVHACQLFHLTYCVNVISILKQDIWVSSYKHKDPFQLHILRTLQLPKSNHKFRYLLYFLLSLTSVEIMDLCRSIKKDDILCELHAVLRNTTKLETAKLPTCIFFSTGFRGIIDRVK